ncbi:hypothetical protein ATO6_19105 [Oceanicola sp. 22II-s10i]|uniref:MarR family winged helix-turn-helix transcriptional regulator n=1 Tax=Oceanicola sp. 22II-s10i TaxID=1317116 RepID=UPI000B6B7CF5|nr:MarR family transcriptional regulator [Oceanicola sp. 22II-s10i]OWU83254.1 hypothetical protein ATO6_19105 [Oceanicola sp. 22II-s10i]
MKRIAILMHETTAVMRRRFEQAAKPLGLTLNQWKALGILADRGPLRQGALVEALRASPMTVSDLCDRLEKAGLVTREASVEDSRAKDVALTGEGRRKVAQMRDVAGAVFAEVFAGIDPAELDVAERVMARMMENLHGEIPGDKDRDDDR